MSHLFSCLIRFSALRRGSLCKWAPMKHAHNTELSLVLYDRIKVGLDRASASLVSYEREVVFESIDSDLIKQKHIFLIIFIEIKFILNENLLYLTNLIETGLGIAQCSLIASLSTLLF